MSPLFDKVLNKLIQIVGKGGVTHRSEVEELYKRDHPEDRQNGSRT